MLLHSRQCETREALVRGLTVVCVVLCSLYNVQSLYAQRDVFTTVAVIDITSQLGGGGTVSPDGRSLVYVGAGGLHLRDLTTGKDTALKLRLGAGRDVFQNPIFTPDGKRVLVSVSGGTWYYPSDVYSVTIDNSEVQQLTSSRPMPLGSRGRAAYELYYYSAIMSPTSSDILISIYDGANSVERVGVLSSGPGEYQPPRPGNLQVVTDGRPLFWCDDGHSFYFLRGGKLFRFDLDANRSQEIELSGTVIGRLSGTETLVVVDGAAIMFDTVDLGRVARRNFTSLRSQVIVSKARQPERLDVRSLQPSTNGLVLMVYQGATTERLELMKIEPKR